MNKKIATLIAGILLVGIVTAGLVPWLSNIVTGSVEVRGPVFYLDGEHPLGGTSIWGLKLNDDNVTKKSSTFTGSNNKLFVSEKLGIKSFYSANYKITLEAESDNESGQIDAELYYIEGDDPHNKKLDVCSGNTTESVHDKKSYEINCKKDELTGIDPEWRLVLELSDGVNDIKYKIYTEGYSRIEVSAA